MRVGGCLVSFCLLALLTAGLARAEAVPEERARAVEDCRYGRASEGGHSGAFPADDVFRPLLADPKQPQFFASWQAARVRTDHTSANVGSVGFGENFGFYTNREGCNGWQVGLLAGVFSQFNLDAPSSDLVNTDFVVGVPVSWRSGLVSGRVRLYHQSSHLGDEFLLGRPGFNRVNLSFEEIEAIFSLDAPEGWGRVYAGGGYLIHREPAGLDRHRVQWGLELRGPVWHWPAVETAMKDALGVRPVFGVDCKSVEELRWIVNTNVVGGIELVRPGATRQFRILFNYYRGFNPYGQFFAQKIESIGLGLYLAF